MQFILRVLQYHQNDWHPEVSYGPLIPRNYREFGISKKVQKRHSLVHIITAWTSFLFLGSKPGANVEVVEGREEDQNFWQIYFGAPSTWRSMPILFESWSNITQSVVLCTLRNYETQRQRRNTFENQKKQIYGLGCVFHCKIIKQYFSNCKKQAFLK